MIMYKDIVWLTVLFGVYCSVDENNVANDIVIQYQTYCPYKDLCYSSSNFTFRGLISEIPCCGYCSCEENCTKTRTCCPDKVDQFAGPDEIQRIKEDVTDCVYAQLRPFHPLMNNHKSYVMTSRCPNDYDDKEIKCKCSRSYDQFDFMEHVKYLPPVSSSELGGVIYKNYYCALCHSAEMKMLNHWSGEIVCVDSVLSFSDIAQLPEKLANESGCQLNFSPPTSHSWPGMTCDYLIDRCNTTGHWKHYDLELESTCLSYFSPYRGYRNVHCFLCNGHNDTDVVYTCEIDKSQTGKPSFVAILDFKDHDKDQSSSRTAEQSLQCKSDAIYDSESEICRPLVCSRGFRIVGDECLPLLQHLEWSAFGISIEVPFILVPSDLSQEWDLDAFHNISILLKNYVFGHLNLIDAGEVYRVCAANIYIKLKYSLVEVLEHMMTTNNSDLVPYVSHLEIMLQVSIYEIENITKTINEIALLFVRNKYYGLFNIRYKQFGLKYDQIILPSDKTVVGQIDRYRSVVGKMLELDTFLAMVNGFDDPIDGRGVVLIPNFRYVEPCESIMVVQPNPFCTRIELTSDEFNLNISVKNVTKIITDSTKQNMYTFSSMIETANGSGVLVCAVEYIHQMRAFSREESSKVDSEIDELDILSIVCLTISIIALIFTLVVYIILPQLQTLPGLNVMALSFSLLVSYSLFLISGSLKVSPSSISCQVTGLLLHFSTLSGYSWMFICTYHMMRVFLTIKEKSNIRHDKKVFLRYFVFAEFLPLLTVVVTIILSVLSNNGIGYGGHSCYMKDQLFNLYFIGIPMFVVLISNIVMFSLVIIMILRIPTVASSTKQERNNLLIFLKLSSLTGFDWIFGLIFQFSRVRLFAYLFIICNAGQGLFIMLSFVANKRVLRMLHQKEKYKGNSNLELTSKRTNGTVKDSTVTKETKF